MAIDPLLAGLSTYPDECADASLSLDLRRQAHERKHKRFRLELRPAPKDEMIECIEAVGATDLVYHRDLQHVPVQTVFGGVAFAPRRMTISALVDTWRHCRGFRKPVSMPVYDRVVQILDSAHAGLRKADIVAAIGCSEFPVRKALEALEEEGNVTVRYEATRGGGTSRKRYHPVQAAAPVSLDRALGVSL